MLLPRILTTLVGIPLVIAAIYYGGIFYMAFVAAITLLCLYEYGVILFTAKKPVNRISLIVFGFLMMVGATVGTLPIVEGSAAVYLPNFFIAITLFGIFFVEILSPKRSLERVANTFLGVMLIPWALVHLVSLRELGPYGEYFTYILFFTIWIADIFAYFIGTWLGKHRLNTAVSPKKSWEGAIAALVFGTITALFFWDLFIPTYITLNQALILGILISVLSQISDLAESLIKRSTGVKDSSNILPGHGGIFDRFDGFILTAPVIYYVVLYIIK